MAGLYIHIPFCHSKCYYCDFYSTPDSRLADDVVRAMIKEWDARRSEVTEPFTTAYLGGGTPSILDTDLLTMLVNSVLPDNIVEFTIEVNPEDVTADKCRAWRDLSINRVSMGVQSFIDSELSDIGRRHTADQAIESYRRLRDAGFDNISLDLIYGLPGQTLESWRSSVDTLMGLAPEHFSAYSLTFEPGTRLTARLSVGKIQETDDEVIEQMYTYLCDAARRAGYDHYEISNFARPGRRSRHNSAYWEFTPYVGLGPGAHSFDGHTRRFNPSNNKTYIQRIETNGVAYDIDPENDRDRLNDLIFVALRRREGLELSRITDDNIRHRILAVAKRLTNRGVIVDNDRISISEPALLVSDSLIAQLLID